MDIIITPKTQTVETTDGVRMRVRYTKVRHSGKTGELNTAVGFEGVREVKLFVQRWFSLRRIALEPQLEYTLRKYFLSYYRKQYLWYDCYTLACEALGVTLHEKLFLHAFWDTKVLDREPQKGDVVFLVDARTQLFLHAALCIDKELLVSVYGGGGDIEFSSLNDMVRELNARDVLLATPKR